MDLPLNETPCLDNPVVYSSKQDSVLKLHGLSYKNHPGFHRKPEPQIGKKPYARALASRLNTYDPQRGQFPHSKFFNDKNKFSLVNGHYNKGSNEVLRYLFINNLIRGCFLKLGILISDIRLTKTCLGDTTIFFLYHPLITPPKKRTFSSPGSKRSPLGRVRRYTLKGSVAYLLDVLKPIISLKYPLLSIKFVCVKAAHSLVDPQILNDLIKFSIAKNPKFFKPVLQRYLRQFNKLARRISRPYKTFKHSNFNPLIRNSLKLERNFLFKKADNPQ